MIYLKQKRGGQGPVSLHLVTRPPPQSVQCLLPTGSYPQTADDEAAPDAGPMDPSSAGETEVAKAVKAWIALILPSPPRPAELEGKRKMGFLAKSRSQSLVEKKAI